MSTRRARPPIRPKVGPLVEADILRLVRSVESLFATESYVSACTYRQDPIVRTLLKEGAERVGDLFRTRAEE
jgi:hypothetical protein